MQRTAHNIKMLSTNTRALSFPALCQYSNSLRLSACTSASGPPRRLRRPGEQVLSSQLSHSSAQRASGALRRVFCRSLSKPSHIRRYLYCILGAQSIFPFST